MIFNVRTLVYYSIIIAITLQSVHTKRKFKHCSFEITQFDSNPKYIADYVVATNKAQNEMNIDFKLLQTLHDDFWVEILIQRCATKTIANNNCRSIFAYDINVCLFMGQERKDSLNILKTWMKNLMKYGNMPLSCPILNGTYYWQGLKAEKGSIPPFILDGFYRMHGMTYIRNNNLKDMISNTTVMVEIKLK